MTEFRVQASLKDQDGDMVNFRADSNEELAHHLSTFPHEQYAAAKQLLRGAAAAAPIVNTNQQQYQAPAQQAPAQQPWGGQQQQGFQPQQGGGGHPEGKVCELCSKPLELKKTSSGKPVWRCPDWRWNAGNPNGHTNIFA